MNHKRLVNGRTGLLALLVVAAAIAGASSGKLLPSLPHLLSGTPAGAAQLVLLPSDPPSAARPLAPVGTGFTYQGRLKDGANPANGQYDFAFSLHSNPITTTLVSGPITITNQTVTDGLFTLTLDFGSTAFNGDARYLQIKAKRSVDPSYTSLSPRQPVTPAPYALFALKSQRYKNVLVVAQSGGDFTSIQAALDSISDSSSTNRYLVWVGPGDYNEAVVMKQWVDIEGAGEKATKITYASTGTGTVMGATNAELRFLTVESTGSSSVAIALNNSSASPSLLHITVVASGSATTNYSVYNNSASPNMNEVTATASGGTTTNIAVFNGSSSLPNMSNVTAIASGGATYNYGVDNLFSSPNMVNVTAEASDASNLNYAVTNSTSSPNMIDVTATASGAAATNTGVINSDSSPNMTNVTAEASGATANYAVRNLSSSSPSMINVTASAFAGSVDYGVSNTSSSPMIVGSTINTSGGASNYGVFNSSSGTVTIDSSKIIGSSNTINNGAGVTTRVGASQLSGGNVSNSGTLTCYADYDENYTAPGISVCP